MQVFVFDLLPYGGYLDDLEHGKALPYPLGKDYFDSDRRGEDLCGASGSLGVCSTGSATTASASTSITPRPMG